MALLAVQTPGTRLSVRSGALALLRGDDLVQKVAVHDVDEVHLYGNADFTPAARRLLLRRGVDTLFFTAAGSYLGRLVSTESAQAERRAAQYRWLTDDGFALALARRFVAGKLRNQRSFLRGVARRRPGDTLAGSLAAIRMTLVRLGDAADPDALRGLEGHGTAMYFRGLGAAVTHPVLRFERRTRRPPTDPFNACLSFGYTLLLTRVETAIRRAGLDPYLGALHSAGRGKPSLALDLMEELRPTVVDRLVLRLVNRRQLAPGDFEDPGIDVDRIAAPDDEPAPDEEDRPRPVYLAETGRAIFLRALGQAWRTPVRVPRRDGRFPLSAVVDQQAMLVARCLEACSPDDYRPFVMF